MTQPTPKETIALQLLLSGGPQNAQELVRAADGGLSFHGIYTTMKRLSDKGLVASRVVETPPGERGPKRRLYTVTDAGEAALGGQR